MTTAALQPYAVMNDRARWLILAGWACSVLWFWLYQTSPLTPPPLAVGQALVGLWQTGELASAVWVSLVTNAQALVLTGFLTAALAVAVIIPATRGVAMALTGLRFLSLAGLLLTFTLLFPSAHSRKVALLTFGMTVFSATALQDEVLAIPTRALDDARTLRMGPWQVVWEVVILGHAHTFLIILRQNAAMGWAMLTMVEGLVRSEGGVGALLLDERKHFNYELVFAVQTVVLAVGLLQDAGLAAFTRALCPGAFRSQERH